MIGKGAYLKRLTANLKMQSIRVGKEVQGSSPPSVFIGSWGYPNVYAGPMITPRHGDTSVMDTPEAWIPRRIPQQELIGYRMGLIRGKCRIEVTNLESPFVQKFQEISLAGSSIESKVTFTSQPRGMSFSEEHPPVGPSAPIERVEIANIPWHRDLERAFYDSDLKAADAVIDLYHRGVPFSTIQKAFSVGAMGEGKARRLVPTRWSITACDSSIAARLLEQVRKYPILDSYRIHHFSSLHNHYAVLLLPIPWQYEWMEAFLHVVGSEELIFADHEGPRGKKEYSSVGGCYYSCKMAILEALAREKRQAAAIVLREASHGYVPLGVFNVRENVRHALSEPPLECEDLQGALPLLHQQFALPLSRFIEESTFLKEQVKGGQTTLKAFNSPLLYPEAVLS